MATLLEVYDALVSEMKTAFGLTPTRGWPRWEQSQMSAPAVAVLLAQVGKVSRRVGMQPRTCLIDVALFASDEIEMISMLETMQNWLATHERLNVGGDEASIEWQTPANRHSNDLGLMEEDYAFLYTLIFTW